MTGFSHHSLLAPLLSDPAVDSLWESEAQLAHMLAFEAAWTMALGTVGRLKRSEAERLAERIVSFSPDTGGLADGVARDGVPVPALVAQLRAATGTEDGVHSGATSQDVIDTALALTLRAVNNILSARLEALEAALDALSGRFGGVTLMGRTRMQAALPIAAGHRIGTWAAPLAAHRARLDAIRPQIERVQVGGPVGDRAGLGADGAAIADAVADRIGLARSDQAWHVTRDSIAEYAGLMSLISGSLGKIGQDICLMAQQGVDDLSLSGGGGSSAMAHKHNPVLAELLVTLARFNAVQLPGIHHALVHEQERSGSAWALEWMILPQMTAATARGLGASLDLITSIERIGPSPD